MLLKVIPFTKIQGKTYFQGASLFEGTFTWKFRVNNPNLYLNNS
jgi:hypothetical protein